MSYLKKKKEYARLSNLQEMILKVLFFSIVIFETFNYFIHIIVTYMYMKNNKYLF